MKIILTGATGAAGLKILRTAISDPSIQRISVLSRRPLPPSIPESPKVSQILHTDFLSYPPELLSRLSGHGACIWAQGCSSVGMKEDEYFRVTHDYPVEAFRAFNEAGLRGEDGKFRFVFVSGDGADETGKSKVMFSRIKGKTETDLVAYASTSSPDSLSVYNLRPGYFYPSDPEDAKSVRPFKMRLIHSVLTPVLKVAFPAIPIKIEDLAAFSLLAGKGYFEPQTYSNARIKELIKKWRDSSKTIASETT